MIHRQRLADSAIKTTQPAERDASFTLGAQREANVTLGMNHSPPPPDRVEHRDPLGRQATQRSRRFGDDFLWPGQRRRQSG
ncbi:hypothetical protein MPRS_44500 [Mycobacterium paraseoulense]|nr:hypothetical protein MPRS_44500 [Mycobacterium paraseoulense]